MKDLPFMPGFIHLLPGFFSQEFVSWIGFVGGLCLEHVDFSPWYATTSFRSSVFFARWVGISKEFGHDFACTVWFIFKAQMVASLLPVFFWGSLASWELTYIPCKSKIEDDFSFFQRRDMLVPWRIARLIFFTRDVVFSAETSFPAAPHEVSQSLAQKSKCNVTGMCVFFGVWRFRCTFRMVFGDVCNANGSIHFANFRVPTFFFKLEIYTFCFSPFCHYEESFSCC